MKRADLIYYKRARGTNFAWRIIEEARREGVQLSLAFALIEQETSFTNVFGHDPTIFRGAGAVTKAKYLAYKRQRGPNGRGGMQGVGPAQLTYFSFQDEADREGGCWKPRQNIRVGLRLLASNIRQHGEFAGVKAYNGSGQAATNYARRVLQRRDVWHRRLTAA
jgi:soluble lytic murein transglycosylase-like protein